MAYSREVAEAPIERLDQAIAKVTQRPRPVGRRPLTPPSLRPKPGVKR